MFQNDVLQIQLSLQQASDGQMIEGKVCKHDLLGDIYFTVECPKSALSFSITNRKKDKSLTMLWYVSGESRSRTLSIEAESTQQLKIPADTCCRYVTASWYQPSPFGPLGRRLVQFVVQFDDHYALYELQYPIDEDGHVVVDHRRVKVR
jgi:hypothetical protein